MLEGDPRYISSHKLSPYLPSDTQLGKSPGRREDWILPCLPVENQEQPVENVEYLCGKAGESVGKTEAKDKICKQRTGDWGLGIGG